MKLPRDLCDSSVERFKTDKLAVNHLEFLREIAQTLWIRVCLFPPCFASHSEGKNKDKKGQL